MKSFITALQFLTRIPMPINIDHDPKCIGRSLLWYPLVGLLIGTALYVIAIIMESQSNIITAIIILIAWVLLTGGLHLDGLADSADAWAGGYGDKEKTLQIMKDPHVGSLAVVVLVLVLLLKFAALGELVKSGDVYYLVLAPMLGRCAVVFLFLTTPYVREQGLGSDMVRFMPRNPASIILLLFIVPALILQPVVVISAVLVLMALRYLMIRRIAGMTGDTIGAAIEIIEAIVLVSLALV